MFGARGGEMEEGALAGVDSCWWGPGSIPDSGLWKVEPCDPNPEDQTTAQHTPWLQPTIVLRSQRRGASRQQGRCVLTPLFTGDPAAA